MTSDLVSNARAGSGMLRCGVPAKPSAWAFWLAASFWVNWELLAELYRHEFEREPFVVTRATAVDVAEAAIRTSRLWRERREDLEALARQGATPHREPKRAPEVPSTLGAPSTPTVDPEIVDEAVAIRALGRRPA